ncbi:uncharacterized protein NECHADRAFT_88613 [Fusarium vanettenii 77-13-4]|uniref:C2H2-type domain-containing protein n=1 Tax=Fusarium vanettenii (strain ATCC MYA-4622 / CBS 123669 / FGSC 9596 / NRRL 45880 / 77-13-4) TaxID=660122 RepID=C7ZC05_FUSV7|nr:uncharacterized protein NECHADRAFT_88613 [Fusarium vanettenii 77-13-4]EEU38455.1 hypothetical protein NECHADRAFT_88613 [Fusarium vanettenii 77-13-4]
MIGIPSGRDTEELPSAAEFAQDLDYDLDFQEDDFFTWMQEQVEDTDATWTTTDLFLPTSPSETRSLQASATDVVGEPSTSTTPMGQLQTPAASVPPKSGRRFSTRVAKILRNWFAAHQQYPYATAEDLEMLQDQTGLSRQQVTNWLVNARRRSKPPSSRIQASYIRDATQSTSTGPNTINIPRRPPTPMPCEEMSPLQRWQHSPPECEPATVASISRAVAASPKLGPFSPISGRSSDNASSVSSAGNSHSSRGSGSHTSAHSYSSGSSLRILARHAGRRRRRRAPKRQGYPRPSLFHTYHTYQCTFCPETFKTKHNWTRHEKSLHLSLERWVCSPNGATAMHPEQGISCIYCRQADPNEPHLNARLVHGTKYMEWPMDSWKTDNAEIRSRCGFCGEALSSWAIRVDHLADHFKSESTMADWKGDWGFDHDVNEMIENAIPPYLIHYEQTSPLPFSVTQGPAGTPTSAYELIKLELECYMYGYLDAHGRLPSDHELQCEGCSIIFGAKVASGHPVPPAPSWLRDIFTSSTEIVQQARLRPMEQVAKSRMSQLKINGKSDIFEGCELESQLCRLVAIHNMIGLPMTDYELQKEAANLLDRIESDSPNSSQLFTGFLTRLVWMSNKWLAPLRDRGRQFPAESIADENNSQPDLATVHSPNRPANSELASGQLQGGLADLLQPSDYSGTPVPSTKASGVSPSPLLRPKHGKGIGNASTTHRARPLSTTQNSFHGNTPFSWTLFNNDSNSYRRLARGLSRFVMTTMSSNNPSSHVPTDEELKYQARWIWYGDDDPWNQTPADNAEWLRDFKRDCGLIADDGRDVER